MRIYLWERITNFFSSLLLFIKNNIAKISVITGLTAVIVLLQVLGVWLWIIAWMGSGILIFGKFTSFPWNAPVWVWLVLLCVVFLLLFLTIRNYWYVGKVAGEFHDDFRRGLSRWEYSGDWRIEDEDGKAVLSVANSDSGGFTKKGFNWSDYEFSFETKVIRLASGWIFRANRDNFFMVQLYVENTSKLRPHYHVKEGTTIIWHPDDANAVDLSAIPLKNEIRLLQWIKVRITVEGNQVDIYLDGVHALHYLMSRIGTIIEREFTFVDKENGTEYKGIIKEPVILGDYDLGRVGFRTAPDEHAHFRNIRVKPL